MPTILIIEDEAFIRDILSYSFKKEDFKVLESHTGNDALYKIAHSDIDIILSDVMLPDIDGFDLYKKISSIKSIRTIFLTAKNDITDKLLGINLGADDYITKPFDIREVIARVNMVLRRSDSPTEQSDEDIIQLDNNISINQKSHEVFVNSKPVQLKPKEFQLILTLAQNRNVVLSREHLLTKIWGYDFEGDSRTVDVHIQRVRKKIGETKKDSIIKTVFGVGYKMI